MTKEQAQTWADALRSGKYKQVRHTLQNEHGYCCLGVATRVFSKGPIVDSNGILTGSTFNHQPHVLKILGIDSWEILTGLNDETNMNFDEIADIIELKWVHNAF